jgi:ABC-2 type transport system permease protein
MLWYKAWLETRFRFLQGAILICATCAFFVLGNPFILGTWEEYRQLNPQQKELSWIIQATSDYAYFIWHFVFHSLLQQLWVLLAVLIGFGGLSRESAQGAAGFTLSLPVSRKRLVSVRAAVGLAEITVLGLIPALLIPILSVFIGKPYPAIQGISHSLLMVLAGVVFFSFSVFLSTAIQSEHTPTIIGIATVILFYFILGPYNDDGVIKPLWLKLVDVSEVMAGEPYLTSLATYPWLGLASSLSVALGLFYLSLRITEERDY